jgi:hypothetical protein
MLQQCGEKLSFAIVNALALWKPLSFLIVIALGSEGNVIALYRYCSENIIKAITCNAITF